MSNGKWQMVCPKCRHEFTYDNGYYDKNIAKLGFEIKEINEQLTKYNALSVKEKKAKSKWRQSCVIALQEKQIQIGELKELRKVNDQQMNAMAYVTFKNVVREELGEAKYKNLLEKALAELEAYKISELMRHEYTRSNALSNVTSINKL